MLSPGNPLALDTYRYSFLPSSGERVRVSVGQNLRLAPMQRGDIILQIYPRLPFRLSPPAVSSGVSPPPRRRNPIQCPCIGAKGLVTWGERVVPHIVSHHLVLCSRSCCRMLISRFGGAGQRVVPPSVLHCIEHILPAAARYRSIGSGGEILQYYRIPDPLPFRLSCPFRYSSSSSSSLEYDAMHRHLSKDFVG